MEQIAMDMGNLLVWQFPWLSGRADELRNLGLVAKMRVGGRILSEEIGLETAADAPTWSSDTARGWAAMAVGHTEGLSLDRRLGLIRPFADDPHFAVREWAWLSLRPHVVEHTMEAIKALDVWPYEDSARLRRFASEVTRPRGVWSAHLPILKESPELGFRLLLPLRADPSRYVQNSVGNWLNDASKTRPDWVRSVCRRWRSGAPVESSTQRICQRALRTLLQTEASNL